MAETTLYQLASQGPQQMMSYILRTKSGKLAVIDGGNHLDTDYLLEFLRSISQGKPVVEAWFLTHAHSDHVDAFLDIQREHAGEVDIRHVYYRFPDEGFIAAYEPGDVHTIREWNDLLPRFERLCVPVEEGQRIQVEELLFEVLYIPDPAFTTNAINNSSIVLRLTVDGQRVLFLSDLMRQLPPPVFLLLFSAPALPVWLPARPNSVPFVRHTVLTGSLPAKSAHWMHSASRFADQKIPVPDKSLRR